MAERRSCPTCGEQYEPQVVFCPKDGAPLGGGKTQIEEDPYLGLELAGQFRLEQLIGVGAMGRVYRAHQAGVERNVAVKIIHRELLNNKTLIKRFRQESKIASSLLHPNLVQIFTAGALPSEESSGFAGEAYLVMEFLDGISLKSALAAAGGSLPLPRALHILLQVCDAVGEAHAKGIVHRDLKPDNIMLVRRGNDPDFVKVLDFGIAKTSVFGDPALTESGAIFGTARYISPEGARGDSVGPEGDVYALATLLFQALSGETPFHGENPVSVLVQHVSAPAPDIRTLARASYVPEPIATFIHQNLTKQPSERCPSARSFGGELLAAAQASGINPHELARRSTLFGEDAPESLRSLGVTRSLGVSLELAEQLRTSPLPEAPSQGQTSLYPADEPLSAERPSGSHVMPKSALSGPIATEEPISSEGAGGTLLIEGDRSQKIREEIKQAALPRALGATQRFGSGADHSNIDQTLDFEPELPPSQPTSRASAPPAPSSPTPKLTQTERLYEPRLNPSQAKTLKLDPEITEQGALSPISGLQHLSQEGSPTSERFSRLSAAPTSLPRLSSAPKPRGVRPATLLAGLILGAGIALFGAFALGVFDSKKISVETYLARAEAAHTAERWGDPPGENVLDITNSALEEYPAHPDIISIRKKSAKQIFSQLRDAQSPHEQGASARGALEEQLRLAKQLDPDSQEIQEKYAQLSRAPHLVEPEEPHEPPEETIPNPDSLEELAERTAAQKPAMRPNVNGAAKPPKAASTSQSAGTQPSAAPSKPEVPPNVEPSTEAPSGRWL